MYIKHLAIATSFAAALVAGAVHAAGGVVLTNSILQEVSVVNDKGVAEKKWKPATVITPGAPLSVVIRYANDSPKPADNVEIKNPLAKELAFNGQIGGDAALVDYSLDGGKSWGALERLRVAAANGETRAAQPADVTAIRFKFNRPLKAGEHGEVSFGAGLR